MSRDRLLADDELGRDRTVGLARGDEREYLSLAPAQPSRRRRSGKTSEALEIVTDVSGVRREVRILPPVGAKLAGTLVEGAFRVRGRKPPFCREMVRTLLHGHRYDGTKATRELGLQYTPVAETFRRTIAWARSEGLVTA